MTSNTNDLFYLFYYKQFLLVKCLFFIYIGMFRQYERDKNAKKNGSGLVKRHKNKIIAGIGIITAILLVGYLFSGGTRPNSNTGGLGSIFDPLPVYKSGQGAVNGYVSGPLGLPAVGSTVIAAGQAGGASNTVTSFISVDGKFTLPNLAPGTYNLVVAFPDGTNKVLSNIVVEQGSVQTLNIKY